MIIRTPTRTKTKSFKGEQMDFKFPSNNSSRFETHDEVELNNHFLVNESLRNKKHQITKEKDLMTPLISDNTPQSHGSKRKNLNVNLSNGYYSFANISDNTTSPSFFHETKDSDANSDIISMLNINGNSKHPRSEYPQTLAPKKTVRDFSLVESLITPLSSPPSSSSASPQQDYTLPSKVESPSIKSNKTEHTTSTEIPTADNLSYDIISSSSLSCLNSSKMESLRLPSSSSSSNFSSRGSLHRASSTVKRTPMRLYRKPTMRKVDSMEFFSISSDNDSGRNSNKNGSNQTDLYCDNIKSKFKSKPNPNNNNDNNNNNKNNKINNNKPVRRMSSMRAHPKSTLKRSKAIKCKGGLLRYFEMIGIKIKKLVKHIRLLLFRKRTVNNYRSKNFNVRRSFSSISSINDHQSLLTKNKKNKKLRNNCDSKKINHIKPHKYHVPNSSSLQALQPALIEKVKPATINEEHALTINTNKDSISTTGTDSVYSKNREKTDVKSPIDSITNSPDMNNLENITTTTIVTTTNNNNHNNNIISPSTGNRGSTRTISTLRRTNSSIRRAASILTASTPSSSTYYSAVTCQENGSPVRKSRLIKSTASTSLSSLVRQPSIVVKNKVIPLSMSIPYSMNETNDDDLRYGSPLMENNVLDTFDTIKEEDEEDEKGKVASNVINSDSDSSIFTELGTTIENTTESVNNNNNSDNIDSSIKKKNGEITEDDGKKEKANIDRKEQRSSVAVPMQKSENKEHDYDNGIDYVHKKEEMGQLMKTYLSQIIQKRILMRLQMVKFQESNVMESEYKQMIDDMVSDYETECHENFMVLNTSENNDESDTSASITSTEEYTDSLHKFNQLNTTTDVDKDHEDDINGVKKNSPISLQYPSRDVLFGMNTLMGSNREKVLSIPASAIKRSMTLPIGMKV